MTRSIWKCDIWVCTLRKSQSVLEKLVLYAAYVIDAITALIIGGFIAAYGGALLWENLGDYIIAPFGLGASAIEFVVSVLFAIPWWVYAGAGVLLAIPVYSFLWCVNRETSEFDRENAEWWVVSMFLALPVLFICGWIVFPPTKDPQLNDVHFILTYGTTLATGVFGVFFAPYLGSIYYYLKRTRGSP